METVSACVETSVHIVISNSTPRVMMIDVTPTMIGRNAATKPPNTTIRMTNVTGRATDSLSAMPSLTLVPISLDTPRSPPARTSTFASLGSASMMLSERKAASFSVPLTCARISPETGLPSLLRNSVAAGSSNVLVTVEPCSASTALRTSP